MSILAAVLGFISGKPMTAKDYILKDTCPVCKHHGFRGGPSGGMLQNIQCVNPDCGAWFNVGGFQGQLVFIEAIKGTKLPEGMELE